MWIKYRNNELVKKRRKGLAFMSKTSCWEGSQSPEHSPAPPGWGATAGQEWEAGEISVTQQTARLKPDCCWSLPWQKGASSLAQRKAVGGGCVGMQMLLTFPHWSLFCTHCTGTKGWYFLCWKANAEQTHQSAALGFSLGLQWPCLSHRQLLRGKMNDAFSNRQRKQPILLVYSKQMYNCCNDTLSTCFF